MSRPHLMALAALAVMLTVWSAYADGFSARARVDPGRSLAVADGQGLIVELSLSQAVPYRVALKADPMRVVVELREVSWEGLSDDHFSGPETITASRFGQAGEGWSRLEMALAAPLIVGEAGMATDPVEGTATITLRLKPASEEAFLARVAPEDAPIPAAKAPAPGSEGVLPERRLTVVLDPGHGGVDRGAEAGEIFEADLILNFARELKEILVRTGRYDVILTRNEDIFVSLEGRVAAAHQADADIFLSLHADSLAEGHASGATVYTLSSTASDVASEKLAERHDRADLLRGVDLSHHDDVVAGILMDLARAETTPRSDRLADALVAGIDASAGRVNSRPRRASGFSVLKSPDIPSVLVEIGFLSDARDRKDLASPEFRRKIAEGIRDALDSWAIEDAAAQQLLRN